jgi:hypothetical protein
MRYIVLLILFVFTLNFDGLGQCQVGESQVIIEVDGSLGQFNEEVFWKLYNDDTNTLIAERISGFLNIEATVRDTLCLQDGVNFRFEAYDTFGDGWNGAEYNIFYGDGFLIGTGMPDNGQTSNSGSDLEETFLFTGGERPGDDCSLPANINVNETVSVNTALYSNSNVLDPLFDSGREAIFQFTPSVTDNYMINFGEILNLNRGSLQLFDNCYDSTPTRIAFDSTGLTNNLLEIVEPLEEGRTYFIVVSNNTESGFDEIQGNLNISYSGDPVNTTCETGFNLTINGSGVSSRFYSPTPATGALFSLTTIESNVYESFVGPLTYNFTLGSQQDIAIQLDGYDVFQTSYIELLKQETCGDTPEATYKRVMTEGSTRVFAFDSLVAGTYRLNIYLPSFANFDVFQVSARSFANMETAQNQDCATAATANIVSSNDSYGPLDIQWFSLFNANDSGTGVPCTQDSIFSAGTPDLWVKTQVPYIGDLVVETFGEFHDVFLATDQALETRFSVYTGNCGSLSEFYCSDKYASHQRDTISGLNPGEEVFIRLWDRNGDDQGKIGVRLLEPTPLPQPQVDILSFTDSLNINFLNQSGDSEFFYQVLFSEDSFATTTPYEVSSFSGQLGIANLQPATEYYFKFWSEKNKLSNSDTTVVQVQTEPYFINTIANGNWSDPNTWQGGVVPAIDSAVNIRHQVSINSGESFDINGVTITGAFEEWPNVGLWINNGSLNVKNNIRVEHLSGVPTDSVGIFMFADAANASLLDVGKNLVFELNDAFNGEQIQFSAINNGDSLKINVGNEFSFRHSASDSTQLYDSPNINFQSVDFSVGGNLFLFNDNFNSAQPFNAIFQDSRIVADVFDLNALENTNGKFQVNFVGTTEIDVNFNFKRQGNGGKIKFADQSTLRFSGLDYQEISGFGDFQDSIIYNNVVIDIEKDLNNGRDIPILNILPSYEETFTKVLIEGELNFIRGLLTDESGLSGFGLREVVFGENATSIGANANSYINGVSSKIGNTPFTFPVGHDAGLRQIRILDNEEFQVSDLVRVNSVNNFCGLSNSVIVNSALVRDRTAEYWEITSSLFDSSVAATFEPIVRIPNDEGITDFTSLELVNFYDGSSLGNGFSTDSSFQTAVQYNFSSADTARFGLASNLETQNPFYYRKDITSLSQYSAAPGENITINYSGPFASASDQVFIGGKLASPVSNTANSLTVTVPEGARSGKIELVYEIENLAYSRQSFTIKYNNSKALLINNYAVLSPIETVNGSVLLGQTNMQLGQIDNDASFDAMIVSRDYQSVTQINNLSGTPSKQEFNLFNEGTLINPTKFELGLSNFNGTIELDAIFEFDVNGDNGLLYYENDGFGSFVQFGEGEADSETIYTDYLFNDVGFDGKTDALFSVFDVSSMSSMISSSSSDGGGCSPYAKSILPFLEPANRNISSMLIGDFIDNGSPDMGFLIDDESIIGILNLYNQDTSFYYSNNSRAAGQIFEIKNISLFNDGTDQIVASNQSTNEIEIYNFDTGAGSFNITSVPLSFTPAKMQAEDINGDGFQDLIVSDQNTAALHVLLNDGLGQLTEDLSLTYTGGIIADFDVLDLNNDGVKDFIILQEGGQLSAIYYEALNLNVPIISSSNITTSSFDLAWDSVENAVQYEIFISLENDTVSSLASDSTFILGDTALSFNAPSPFETYYIFGRSISASGDTSVYSNPLTVQLTQLAIPEPISSNPSSLKFDLSWPAVEGADQYQVYVGLNNDTSSIGGNDSLFVVSTDSITYQAPEYSELYYYFVRSISSFGDTSAFSLEDSIKLPVSTYLEQDSLAMLAFYENNNGVNWTSAQNWTSGKLNTWEGLVMINDSLKAINLPSNQISGLLPNELANLNFVSEINISDNSINDISALESLIGNLNSLDVSGNELNFEKLEAFNTIPTFNYGNQNFSYNLPAEFFNFLGANISMTVSAPAASNTFQWYKDSVQITGATDSVLVLNNLQRADEGLYYVEVNNDLLGNLTLSSTISEVKVSSLERDVAALRQFYDSTNGDGWSSITWDTTSDNPTEWSANETDIVVEDNRVVEINLPDNNLTGSVPDILNEVLGLRSINLSNNAIENLTNLSTLPDLAVLDVSGNALGYDDLIPNIVIDGLIFNDQARFGNEADQKLPQGSAFSIEYSVEGSNNTYQWFLNNDSLNISDSSSISVDSLTYDLMGEYSLKVGNDLINAVDPEFRLVSNPVQIIASANITGSLADANDFPTESGKVYLFKFQEGQAFDSVLLDNGNYFENVQEGGIFELQDVELGDYLLYVDNNEIAYPNLLNTYLPNTIDWELAEIIALRTTINDLKVTMEGEPEELNGTSILSGFLEEEFDESERRLPRRRVSGAGVSVRRLTGSSREVTFKSILQNGELVAYLETDENGEFTIPNLPAGSYTVKFDIPGVPMNEQSDINFELTGEDQEALEISAVSDNGQITVTRVSYTANKTELTKNITVYPNPSSGKFKISGTDAITNIKIISSECRLLQEFSDFNYSSQEIELDLSSYPDGMYFMQVIWKDGLRSMNKLIKE